MFTDSAALRYGMPPLEMHIPHDCLTRLVCEQHAWTCSAALLASLLCLAPCESPDSLLETIMASSMDSINDQVDEYATPAKRLET